MVDRIESAFHSSFLSNHYDGPLRETHWRARGHDSEIAMADNSKQQVSRSCAGDLNSSPLLAPTNEMELSHIRKLGVAFKNDDLKTPKKTAGASLMSGVPRSLAKINSMKQRSQRKSQVRRNSPKRVKNSQDDTQIDATRTSDCHAETEQQRLLGSGKKKNYSNAQVEDLNRVLQTIGFSYRNHTYCHDKIDESFEGEQSLRKYLCLHGIPNIDQLPKEIRRYLETYVKFAHVPFSDWTSAKFPIVEEIPSDEKIRELLPKMGFDIRETPGRTMIMASGSSEIPNESLIQGEHYFLSLSELRVFIRSHENRFVATPAKKRTRNSNERAIDLLRSQEHRSLRLWAATSEEPLPIFIEQKHCTTTVNAKRQLRSSTSMTSSGGNQPMSETLEVHPRVIDRSDEKENDKDGNQTKQDDKDTENSKPFTKDRNMKGTGNDTKAKAVSEASIPNDESAPTEETTVGVKHGRRKKLVATFPLGRHSLLSPQVSDRDVVIGQDDANVAAEARSQQQPSTIQVAGEHKDSKRQQDELQYQKWKYKALRVDLMIQRKLRDASRKGIGLFAIKEAPIAPWVPDGELKQANDRMQRQLHNIRLEIRLLVEQSPIAG